MPPKHPLSNPLITMQALSNFCTDSHATFVCFLQSMYLATEKESTRFCGPGSVRYKPDSAVPLPGKNLAARKHYNRMM